MAAIDLKSLVGKLNAPCRRALEGAAGLTLSRSQFNVEIEHWLVKLLEDERSDVAACLRHYEIAVERVAAELARSLDRLKTGNAHPPALSPSLVTLGREAWLLATLEYGDGQIRSGHLLVALLSDETLGQHARAASPSLARIPPDELRRRLAAITAASAETAETVRTESAGPGPAAVGRTEALDRYTIDLTERARAGRLDPVLGRDGEIRQVIDILTRRRQNNPILTGEAGVGKTAVVEGFALRIAAGDVPEDLRNVSLRTLDLGLLQAGAGVKGEFENRLKSVIEEVQASPRPIILFIDEAHTLIGAGGQAGQGDAANLLKPALARGELRTVAATTWSEYKKYFEKDAALTRRFQVVKVDEPGEAAAIDMMRGVVPMLEAHHGVRILDEAVEDCVRLSHRYVAGRQLPDKSMSLLDTACARVAMAHAATPEAIEERRRRIERLEAEIAILRREEATGEETGRIADLQALRDQAAAEHEALRARWAEERGLVDRIRGLRDRIEAAEGLGPAADEAEGPSDAVADVAALRAEYAETRRALAEMQGEAPLIPVEVDAQAVAEVVANWTGIPVGRMVSDEIRSILALEDRLRERVVGQNHALEVTARAIRTARAKLTDPRKPIGVFLFLGPSGVGKTETALALADLLYGGEQNLTVINMSEFKEEHKVSLLLGSPPGYVGYGEGGVLTEAVRRRPYSVVLLDELEKAHPGVQDVFYQVFDKGMLRDGEGRDIDFKNTVIILTSNVGTDLIAKLCADPDTAPAPADLAAALRPELLKTFKPAFLGRLSVIPFLPLDDDTMRSIARLQLERIRRRIEESYGARFSYDDSLVDELRARATESESGARAIEQILANTVLPELAAEFLAHMADSHPVRDASVSVDSHGTIQYRVS